jgi:hypothetical protein
MLVLLEQVDTIDLDGLIRKVTALSNKDKVTEADVKEDKGKVYRFGTVAVRWSHLSDKWILQDGVAIEGAYETAKAAIQRAKEVSGYEEETQAQIIHTTPLPMEFDGTIPLDAIQSFQPTPVSSLGGGGRGFGGSAPVSLNIPSLGGSEGADGSSMGNPPLSTTGGPSGSDTALPEPAAGGEPSAADIGT